MKDSRSLTSDDLRAIVEAIEESPATRVIITHGTYTMPDTARYIQAHVQRKDQVITLTGSMIPLDGFIFSDAGFNLGYAVAQTAILKPGVYVCMNGQVFAPGDVIKIVQEGRFSSIFNT